MKRNKKSRPFDGTAILHTIQVPVHLYVLIFDIHGFIFKIHPG